jgi:hypothetical protein
MTTKKVEDAYAYGFATKCAEAGIDPEELVKFAQTEDDRLSAYLTSLFPGLSAMYGASRAPEGEKLKQALKTQLAGTAGRVGGGLGGMALGGLLGAGLGAAFGRPGAAGLGLAGAGAGLPLGVTAGGGEATYRAGQSPDKIERIKEAIQEFIEDLRD